MIFNMLNSVELGIQARIEFQFRREMQLSPVVIPKVLFRTV